MKNYLTPNVHSIQVEKLLKIDEAILHPHLYKENKNPPQRKKPQICYFPAEYVPEYLALCDSPTL